MADRKKNSHIFRQKSLERISSPENLDKYIKSTTPSLWILLGAVILLLVGTIVWASFGKLDSASVVGCEAHDGMVTAFIKEAEFQKLNEDSYIEIGEEKYAISAVEGPSVAGEESDPFLIQAGGIENGDWYYILTCKADLDDGAYKGKIVYEKITPITFIIN